MPRHAPQALVRCVKPVVLKVLFYNSNRDSPAGAAQAVAPMPARRLPQQRPGPRRLLVVRVSAAEAGQPPARAPSPGPGPGPASCVSAQRCAFSPRVLLPIGPGPFPGTSLRARASSFPARSGPASAAAAAATELIGQGLSENKLVGPGYIRRNQSCRHQAQKPNS